MSLDLDPAIVDALAQASPSETTPLLLELSARQAGRRRPIDLVQQMKRDAFVQPLFLEQRLVHQLDGLALDAAMGFEALQLSPVAPLGACSVIAPTSQNRTLSALRGTELVSDPTNVFALLCAQRLLADPTRHLKLCTVHQTLRAQSLPEGRGRSRHFRLFALAEAGVGRPDDGFEVDALTGAIETFDRLFDRLERDMACRFPQRRVVLRQTAAREILARRVQERLVARLPHLEVQREPLDSSYYDGLRFMLWAHSQAGEPVPIGDGGVFDWLHKLTSNRRFRFVASGFGLQLAPILFRPAGSTPGDG
jgi:hypothetical protein